MTKPDVTVRLAQAADLDAVNRDHYISDEVLLKKIAEDEVFLVAVAGETVGYLRLEYLWSIVPYIALIRVEATHRGQGYGRKLLEFVENFLRDRGIDVLYSSSTGDEAAPQSWHRHMGFVECGFIAGMNEGG